MRREFTNSKDGTRFVEKTVETPAANDDVLTDVASIRSARRGLPYLQDRHVTSTENPASPGRYEEGGGILGFAFTYRLD